MRQWDSNHIFVPETACGNGSPSPEKQRRDPRLPQGSDPALLLSPPGHEVPAQQHGGHQPSPFASRASWDAWPSILASSRPGGDSLIRPAAVQEAVSHRATRQPKLLLPDRACTLFFLHSACCLRDTRNQPVSLLFAHFAAFFF